MVVRHVIRLRRAPWLAALLLLLPTLAHSQTSVVGQWSSVMNWPQAPVHMTLQPDGNIVMWPATCGCVQGAELGGGDHVRVWNPGTNQFTLNPSDSNVFCSAHAPLADGRTLVVGGHIEYFVGLRDTNIFNADRTWTRVDDMDQPRWYPSAVRLADGRVLAISGNTTEQFGFADIPEVFNPDPMVMAWTPLTNASMRIPAYPFLFVVPGGTVVVAGPDRITRRLNVATQTWTTIGDSFITAHSAVQYRPGRIMKSGTFGNIDEGVPGVEARTVVLDTTVASPAWRETAPMANQRAFHTLTLLPDGQVLVTGGNRSGQGQDTTSAVNPAELWNPTTETWRTLASAQRPRLYHSTALLLPDGRVVSAGGEFAPYLQQNAEIYSPPYLFNGTRPTITSVPSTPIAYGANFTVQTPATPARVTLLAPASVTHGVNMNQRFLELSFTPVAGGVSVTAPASADLAPPGFYMVFVLNASNVPSVGRFIQILPSGGTTTTTTPTPSTTSTSTAPVPSTTSSTSVTPTTTSSTTSTLPPAAGLVAAYAFDENGSSSAADASGNANTGTLAGPTWLAPGRFSGSSLVFNGAGVHVAIADRANLDLTELTLEAWVYPTATAGYRMIMAKTTTGQPVNYYFALQDGILNFGFLNGSGWREHRTAVGPALNTWSHVAVAFSDSANQVRIYLNGNAALTATETTSPQINTEQLRIGVGFSNEGFTGRIDEVRVYNRALSAAEIAADVNRPVGSAGTSTSTSSSTSSSSSSSTSSSSSSSTSSTSSTTSTSSTSSTSAPTPTTTSTSRTTTSSTSTSTSTSSTSTSTSSTSSTSAPTPTTSSTSTSSTSSSSSSSTTSTSSSSSSTTPPPPTTSTTATPTTSTTTSTSAVPSGLVAAYGFEETTGSSVIDNSGNGRTGTITGAIRTPSGQLGRALSFDGVDDRVSVADAASLDLTAGVTLEAWVNPTDIGGWRMVVAKTTNGTPNNYFLALDDGVPTFGFFNTGWREHTGGPAVPANAWTHVAATFSDAANSVRLYVNGVEVLSSTETASLVTNTAQLRIGVGFSNEAFAGRIDELRVYNRTLNAAEIAADRLRAVP